jgi:hypothetical protein
MRIGGVALMNTHRCCEAAANDSRSEPFAAPATDREPHPPTFTLRCLAIAGWMAPGAILAILPKCPACLAAYAALWTGLGLSLSTATHLRALLLILCVSSLLYLVVKRLCRFVVVREALLRAKVIFPRSE